MRPVTVHEVEVVAEQVRPPGVAVTVYLVMTLPPFWIGAVQDTTEDTFVFEVALTPVGASGTVAGAVAVDGFEERLEPAALVATIVNW